MLTGRLSCGSVKHLRGAVSLSPADMAWRYKSSFRPSAGRILRRDDQVGVLSQLRDDRLRSFSESRCLVKEHTNTLALDPGALTTPKDGSADRRKQKKELLGRNCAAIRGDLGAGIRRIDQKAFASPRSVNRHHRGIDSRVKLDTRGGVSSFNTHGNNSVQILHSCAHAARASRGGALDSLASSR